MPVLFGRRCVAPILTRLAQRCPKLQLDLNFSDRLVDLIEDGFDLAIRNGTLTESVGLTTRRVARQRMTVCAAPSYLAAHGAPRKLEDLSDHDAITYTFRQYGRVFTWTFPSEGQKPVEIATKTRILFDDLEAIADAASAGLGLAWLPCWLIRDRVRDGVLVRVLDDQPGLAIDSHAVWPQTPTLPLRVRLAIDALAAELPGATEM
jgi:DNA-binding transcriptional LysR family regulator